MLDNLPAILLGAAMLTSGVLLVALTSHLTWRFDDWDVLLFRPGWTAHSLLDPHYEHITLSQIAIYKVLLDAFGMNSLIPFSVVATLAYLLAAMLLFVYLRRRVGDWPALMAAAVILFLGAASEDLLWPIQILHSGSIACGLGMLLALQREDRTGDRLACVLLVGSISFFSIGLSFAAGAAVDIVQRREVWRSRIYIVAVPALLYAAWWLGWGHTADTSLTLHDIGAAPLFMLDMMAAGIASVLGLANTTSVTTVQGSLAWGRPLLPIVVLLAIWRLQQLEKVPRWLWVIAAISFSTWILAAVGSQPGRPPDASRYQYPSAVFIFLLTAELMRGVRFGRNALLGVSAIAIVSLMGNITQLFDFYKVKKVESEQERAVLGAVEVARGTVPRTFEVSGLHSESTFTQTLPYIRYVPSPEGDGAGVFTIPAATYLKAVDDWGSPAYSPAELATSPELARQVADSTLAAALGIKLAPTMAPPSVGPGSPPSLIGPADAMVRRNANCLVLNASESDPPLLDLPPGGATITSGSGGEFQVRLRRFASTILPVDLGTLPAHAGAVLDIPTDRSTQPWKLSLAGSGRVTVCGRHS